MMAFFQKIWAWFLGVIGAIEKPPSHIVFVSRVPELVGMGMSNYWPLANPMELAACLYKNGCTATHIELHGAWELGYYENQKPMLAKLKPFVEAMRQYGIVTFINMVNGNYGEAGSPSKASICATAYDDKWFNEALDFIINELGPKGIVVQPTSEWAGKGKPSEQCNYKDYTWSKLVRAKCANWMRSQYTGGIHKPWVGDGWFFSWHPQHVGNPPGPSGYILVTDCGGVLQDLGSAPDYADPAKIAAYAKSCRKNGCGFIHYGYECKKIPEAAIKAIGEGWRS